MAEKNDEAAQEEICNAEKDGIPEAAKDEDSTPDDSKDLNTSDDQETQMPGLKQEEEIIIKKKYGGLLKKKQPLISKDHEHAFFDSADWALGKAGKQKSKGPLEALRPKLQPTQHQQIRSRSAYAPAGDCKDNCESNEVHPMEKQDSMLDDGTGINDPSPDNRDHQKDDIV